MLFASQDLTKKLSSLDRRTFLKLTGGMGSMAFLTACGPASEGTSSDADTADDSSAEGEDAGASTFAADGTLRVGMEAAYAPFNWQVSEESENTIPIENVSGAFADGYDVQFAKIIAEALELTPVAVKMSFDGLVDACKSGQIDIICAGMTATEERAKSIDFSDPYLEDTVAVITKKDSKYASAKTLEDLTGVTIMGQKSTFYDEAIDQIPEVVHKEPLEYVPDVVAALNNDQVEAITYSAMSAAKLLDSYPDFVLCELESGFTGDYASNNDNAGIAKGNDDILKKINEAIADVSEEERADLWTACNERMPV